MLKFRFGDATKKRESLSPAYSLSHWSLSEDFLAQLERLHNLFLPVMEQFGKDVFLVGGEVRNQLMGLKQPPDYDVATSASEAELRAVFGEQLKAIRASFPVWLLVTKWGEVEVARFRKEFDYQGRFPRTIGEGDFESDAERRDLTINSIYISLKNFNLLDPNQGLEDLQNHLIRLIGNPFERLEEDRLRVIRVMRFAANTGFSLEKETEKAIHVYEKKLEQLSLHRILTEIEKIWPGKIFSFLAYTLSQEDQKKLQKFEEEEFSQLEEKTAITIFFQNYPKTSLFLLSQSLNIPLNHWSIFRGFWANLLTRKDERFFTKVKRSSFDSLPLFWNELFSSVQTLEEWKLVCRLKKKKDLEAFLKDLEKQGACFKDTLKINLKKKGLQLLGVSLSSVREFFLIHKIPFVSHYQPFLFFLNQTLFEPLSFGEKWKEFETKQGIFFKI